MPLDRTAFTMRQNNMCNQALFTITKGIQDLRYTENHRNYVWGKSMTRMVLEVQCLALALIVTSQVWILSYYGTKIFENLIGNDIMLPLLYLTAVIMGTLTYVHPTYWRIASSLTIYSVCIYFSLMVTTFELQILMTPTLTELMLKDPFNTGVWIPWAIGFAFHMHMCITSAIISVVSIRDMYYFEPVVMDKREAVEDVFLYPKQCESLSNVAVVRGPIYVPTHPFSSFSGIPLSLV